MLSLVRLNSQIMKIEVWRWSWERINKSQDVSRLLCTRLSVRKSEFLALVGSGYHSQQITKPVSSSTKTVLDEWSLFSSAKIFWCPFLFYFVYPLYNVYPEFQLPRSFCVSLKILVIWLLFPTCSRMSTRLWIRRPETSPGDIESISLAPASDPAKRSKITAQIYINRLRREDHYKWGPRPHPPTPGLMPEEPLWWCFP